MTAPVAPRVRALSFHAGYRCRNSGACCTSGWDIPVETMHLRNALESGALRIPEAAVTSAPFRTHSALSDRCFRAVSGLPHGARVVLASDPSGRCVFLESDRRCAVHRQLGSEALPSACRDFPRIVTLTPLGVSVTLSHYCPTAASMLFAPVTPVTLSDFTPVILRDTRRPGPEGSAATILENPPGFPLTRPYEGLDARDALPPFLRPGVLMDWPSLERWEEFAVSVLADDTRTPEQALDVLAGVAERARRWTAPDGPFGEWFASSLRGAPSRAGARRRAPGALEMTEAWRLVADCVPHRSLLPAPPQGLDDAGRGLVAPGWPSLSLPIRRWLASKAFASWLALQGEGLRTTVHGLRVALGVLEAEAARGCAEAGRVLDAELLRAAVRRADLLLLHLADPEALARRLGRGETAGPPSPA